MLNIEFRRNKSFTIVVSINFLIIGKNYLLKEIRADKLKHIQISILYPIRKKKRFISAWVRLILVGESLFYFIHKYGNN